MPEHRIVVLAAGAHDELDHPVGGVEPAGRVLGCEPLVIVVVAGEDHVRSRQLEVAPERDQPAVVPVQARPGWRKE